MNKVKSTEQQKKAVNGILQGKSARASMIEAGYSEKVANNPKLNLLGRTGVQVYLKKFDKASRQKYGMNLGDKLIDVYTDGLAATKLYGKNAIKHPDYGAQYLYANKLSELLSWTKKSETPIQTNQQFNFFGVGKEESSHFHSKLKELIMSEYQNKG